MSVWELLIHTRCLVRLYICLLRYNIAHMILLPISWLLLLLLLHHVLLLSRHVRSIPTKTVLVKMCILLLLLLLLLMSVHGWILRSLLLLLLTHTLTPISKLTTRPLPLRPSGCRCCCCLVHRILLLLRRLLYLHTKTLARLPLSPTWLSSANHTTTTLIDFTSIPIVVPAILLLCLLLCLMSLLI